MQSRGATARSIIPADLGDLAALLSPAQLTAAVQRHAYRNDPVSWVHTHLREATWSKQREIMQALVDHPQVAVHSCHSSGKTHVAARVICHWLSTHPVGEAFVVTSASTIGQSQAGIWREVSRAHDKGRLLGRLNQTEWYMPIGDTGREELVARAIKPADDNATAMHGIHAKYVLVVIDEACAFSNALWDAALSLVSNEYSRILAIGNPDDPESEFRRVCRPGSGWHVIGIGAHDTPNFTAGDATDPNADVPQHVRDNLISRRYEEMVRRKYGVNNPVYISKIRGEFPDASEDTLFPMAWITQAQRRWRESEARGITAHRGVNKLGVDVGAGGDKTTIAHRTGNRVRIIVSRQEPDTMVACGLVVRHLKQTRAECAQVDYIGVGRGVVNRAREIGAAVIGITVSAKADKDDEYANLRAEGYWRLRDRFEPSCDNPIEIDPDDEELAAELASLKFKQTSTGKFILESKREMKRRGERSPDRADAAMLAFLDRVKRKRRVALGGRGRLRYNHSANRGIDDASGSGHRSNVSRRGGKRVWSTPR